jgi:flagellar hook assembly protein FlgD
MAEKNWWGTWPPPAGKFNGAVDYNPYLTGVPTSRARNFEVAEVPKHLSARFSPNPTDGAGEIWLSIPLNAEYYIVEILDIQGRLVRTIASKTPAAPGTVILHWDGSDDRGRLISSGAYLVRARTARETRVAKILRLQ